LAFAAHVGEWIYLTEYAKEQGWVEKDREGEGTVIRLRLTPTGWEEVQRRPRIESAQGFVAMWFDASMTDAFMHGMKAAIEDDCHYRCRRIDTEEYNGDVVDEIMAQIRESRFVVCDLTGHRSGVYFEAGFAMGLDIPMIWTCRSDHAGQTHFDAEHFNQIRWTSPDKLRKKLAMRIRATIGLGPLKPVER
jgi:nucleoside 2-deoxyribosyltransferase